MRGSQPHDPALRTADRVLTAMARTRELSSDVMSADTPWQSLFSIRRASTSVIRARDLQQILFRASFAIERVSRAAHHATTMRARVCICSTVSLMCRMQV